MDRAKTVHELRQEVKANDKFAAAGKPEAEAIELIATNYKTTKDSAKAFVTWLKGGPATDAPKNGPGPGEVIESWHKQGDLKEGREKLLSDADSAKVRAAAKKNKKR